MKVKIIIAALCVLVLVSCQGGNRYDRDQLDSDLPSLTVNDVLQYRYNENTGQLSYNRKKCEFRAGMDNMSDYFILTLDRLPSSKDETVTGRVRWSTDKSVETLSGLQFKVMRMDANGNIWLWCAKSQVSVNVRVL